MRSRPLTPTKHASGLLAGVPPRGCSVSCLRARRPAQRSTQRAVVALVWGYGFPRGRELATEGVPGSDQDRLNEGLQVCAGQPGPSTLVANRSRVLAVPRHLGLRTRDL